LRDSFTTLVFDLDGTLVETAADLHLVLSEVLAEAGLAAPELTAVRGMIGDGARVLIERALAATGVPADPALVDRLFARFRERYAEVPCRLSEPYPGARELLEGLTGRGVRLGLCTNKPEAATRGLLEALGIARFFASAIGGDRLPVRKPDPGHLAAVLADMGVSTGEVAMVGDSRNDLLTARGLSVPCVLVSFGYTTVPASELGADAVVDRLADLPEALARLTQRPGSARDA
jgi:phosphoglycolate phosphatase